jgi:hypothetical protein
MSATERLPVVEFGVTVPAYADHLARIERHGPVSHLILPSFVGHKEDEK